MEGSTFLMSLSGRIVKQGYGSNFLNIKEVLGEELANLFFGGDDGKSIRESYMFYYENKT